MSIDHEASPPATLDTESDAPDHRAGLGTDAVLWLRERDVALFGGDCVELLPGREAVPGGGVCQGGGAVGGAGGQACEPCLEAAR